MPHPDRSIRLAALFSAAVLLASCDSTSPVGPAFRFKQVVTPPASAVVGTALPGGVTLQVVDANGRAVSNSRIEFVITAGDGTVTPHVTTSDGNGQVHADWTISQTAGDNILIAKTASTDSLATITVVGTPAAGTAVAVTPHTLRLPSGTTTSTVSGSVVDQFGNKITGGTTTYTSKNTSLVTVNASTGAVSVVSGATGTTYIIATGSTFKDSSLVIVLGANDPPCTGLPASARKTLAVGEVVTTGFLDNGVCVDGTAAGGEFAWVPYFDSSVPSAFTTFTLMASGVKTPGFLGSARPAGGGALANIAPIDPNAPRVRAAAAFHRRMLDDDAREMPARAKSARLWYESLLGMRATNRASRSAAPLAVGDLMKLNVNATDYCVNPDVHTGRVVAITAKTVVVSDQANPTGGFTDAELTAYGTMFDTLMYPVDTTAFGTPVDIDNNGGRTILFFTHAVNEQDLGVLGYFYGRDLLPKVGPLGSCTGSNVAEMVYLLVPDSVTSKFYVDTNVRATMAHEFQHLINQARRLYVNTDAAPSEERWLNEGLSHIAEELVFYHASGLSSRQNIGSTALADPKVSSAYSFYQNQNFQRLRQYLASPDLQSPVGANDTDDDLATRGATWSYLRFAADQRATLPENQFWFKLVNSNETGLQNLYGVVGADARLLMRDWTLSILLDDLVAGVPTKYQDLSWNSRQVAGGLSPATRTLGNNATNTVTLAAAGTTFGRFGIAAGGEAYVSASGISGTALPNNVLMALVRTK